MLLILRNLLLSKTTWLVLTIAIPTGVAWIQTNRLAKVKQELVEFRAAVAAAGQLAEIQTKTKTKQDQTLKESVDAKHKKDVAALSATIIRLRNERASSSFVPPSTTPSSGADVAAFDRPELERAIRSLDTGVQGIADEGSAATLDLNTAKAWASSVRRE